MAGTIIAQSMKIVMCILIDCENAYSEWLDRHSGGKPTAVPEQSVRQFVKEGFVVAYQ
jgi:hypothetical protein